MPVENVREIFEIHMPKRFEDAPELSASVNAIYKFVLPGPEGGTWRVDLTTPPGVVTEDDARAQCTLTVAPEIFLDIVHGKLDGKMAVMLGKMKVTGEITLALKLQTLFGN